MNSPSLHQLFYQKLIECFSNYIPIDIIPNILNEGNIHIVIDEIVNNNDFEKLNIEIETYKSIEELKLPQEYDGGIIVLDDLNEKKMRDPCVQAMFKRSGHTTYPYSLLVGITLNCPKEPTELMEKSITYLNLTTSEMYKIFIKTKLLWI